jgi:hypothetical protein
MVGPEPLPKQSGATAVVGGETTETTPDAAQFRQLARAKSLSTSPGGGVRTNSTVPGRVPPKGLTASIYGESDGRSTL